MEKRKLSKTTGARSNTITKKKIEFKVNMDEVKEIATSKMSEIDLMRMIIEEHNALKELEQGETNSNEYSADLDTSEFSNMESIEDLDEDKSEAYVLVDNTMGATPRGIERARSDHGISRFSTRLPGGEMNFTFDEMGFVADNPLNSSKVVRFPENDLHPKERSSKIILGSNKVAKESNYFLHFITLFLFIKILKILLIYLLNFIFIFN